MLSNERFSWTMMTTCWIFSAGFTDGDGCGPAEIEGCGDGRPNGSVGAAVPPPPAPHAAATQADAMIAHAAVALTESGLMVRSSSSGAPIPVSVHRLRPQLLRA